MRGQDEKQGFMYTYLSPEQRVPKNHPLRPIKAFADAVLIEMNLEEASFDATSFTKNRERLLAHEVSLKFFDAVVREARKQNLLSDEHFMGDGTLIDAWVR